jgi:hypothetical protein
VSFDKLVQVSRKGSVSGIAQSDLSFIIILSLISFVEEHRRFIVSGVVQSTLIHSSQMRRLVNLTLVGSLKTL